MVCKSISGLYAITDPSLITDDKLDEVVLAAIEGGISVLQYRNKQASIEIQEQQAQRLQSLCKAHQVTFLINDNVKLAKRVKADGVHIGQDDMAIQQARQQLGEAAIIGVSCYNNVNNAITAEKNGADYIAFGRFFPSKTKPKALPANLELISKAKKYIKIPIVAIGGITLENIDQLIEHKVDATAIINGIFAQKYILETCQQLSSKFTKSL